MLSVDLGIEEKYKPIIEKHIKFFGNKERLQRFYDLEIENFNEENILTGIMSAVCRTRTNSFDEVIRVLITEDSLTDNKYLAEFAKYDIESEFWKLCEQQFGFSMDAPNLEKLVITMFVTYADHYIDAEMPKSWGQFISYKSGNIIAFLDNLMNNILYREKYDELSQYVAECLNASEELSKWYEKEAYEQTWSVRTLQRNIDTQYYYRLLQSKDKEPVEHEMKEKTLTYQQDKLEFIKNPVVVEFLGLTPDISFTETKLEACIITNLQELYKETNLISDQEVEIWQKIRCFPANQRMLSTRLLYQKKAKNT